MNPSSLLNKDKTVFVFELTEKLKSDLASVEKH